MRGWMLLAVAVASGACDSNGVSYVGPSDRFDTDQVYGSTSTLGAGTCNEVDVAWLCTVYTGSSWDPVTIESECRGTYAELASCAAGVGTCVYDPGQPTEYWLTYYEPGYQLAEATQLQSDCEAQGGDWL